MLKGLGNLHRSCQLCQLLSQESVAPVGNCPLATLRSYPTRDQWGLLKAISTGSQPSGLQLARPRTLPIIMRRLVLALRLRAFRKNRFAPWGLAAVLLRKEEQNRGVDQQGAVAAPVVLPQPLLAPLLPTLAAGLHDPLARLLRPALL